MFHKPFRVSQSFDVKSSVKRRIQQKLKEQFGSRIGPSEESDRIWDNVLFPTKSTIAISDTESIPVQVQCLKIEIIEKAALSNTNTGSSQSKKNSAQQQQQPITIFNVQQIQQQKQRQVNQKLQPQQPSQQQQQQKSKQQQQQQQQQQKKNAQNNASVSSSNASNNSNSESLIKINMYTVNNVPMFVQLPGGGSIDNDQDTVEFMPTLFALHQVPNLMKFIVIHSNVSQFILSGADLMLPGLSLSYQPESFDRDELCSLIVAGNPFPFAVGRMTFAFKKGESKKPNDGKGKAMMITHVFNDSLWQYALTNNGHLEEPEGYFVDRIEPIQMAEVEQQQQQEEQEQGEQEEVEANGTSSEQSESEQKPTTAEDGVEEDSGASEEQEEQVSEKEMDDRMIYWFMETIKFHMKDEELPMDTSAIYSRMTSVINRTQYVDVKRSSFRKLAKFMKHVTQLKYIKTKDSGKIITNINRSHPAYLKHEAAKIAKNSDTSASASTGSQSSSNKSSNVKRKVTVINLYKPVGSLKEIFVGDEDKDLYSEAEVRQKLIDYVEKQKLRAGTTNFPVKLDEFLYGQLFHSKKIDSGYSLNSTAPFQVVLQKLMEKMSGQHLIEFLIPKPNGEVTTYSTLHKGSCKGINIDSYRVMGNKHATRINGLAPFLNYTPPPKSATTPLECPQFHDFIKLLKTKVSTGIKTNTDLAPNHDQKKEPEVFMQGDNSKIVKDLLMQEYSINPSMIHITDSTKKKKK